MTSGNGQKPYRVCVLGNFSGRNAGDNAILGNLMADLSELYEDIQFVIPSFNPGFVRKHFSQYNIEVVSLLPWAFSLKIFGLPTFRAVLSADLVLVTDNLLFDMKLYNPIHNYLSTLSLALPLAKKRGIPIVLYNMSLGPIHTDAGRKMMQRVIHACDLITLRDTVSKAMLQSQRIQYGRIEQGADCAINTRPAADQRTDAIIQAEGLFTNPRGTIGFNVNTYLDAYLYKDGKHADQQNFKATIAAAIDHVIEQTGCDVLFVVTQVMDTKITQDVMGHIQHQQNVRMISNKHYTYEELTAIFKRMEMLVAMRTHAVILASSVCTPVMGIISYPKTAGFLDSIEQYDWQICFDNLTVESLSDMMMRLYEQRDRIRADLKPIVNREQAKAHHTAELLAPYLKPKQHKQDRQPDDIVTARQ